MILSDEKVIATQARQIVGLQLALGAAHAEAARLTELIPAEPVAEGDS